MEKQIGKLVDFKLPVTPELQKDLFIVTYLLYFVLVLGDCHNFKIKFPVSNLFRFLHVQFKLSPFYEIHAQINLLK